ncbi:MAG: acyl-[acyl-carrier-protein] thioesterase [Chloroflexota bacterium]
MGSVGDVIPGLSPEPSSGRIFRTRRTVRLSDTSSAGQLRLDAIGRYLQDVATDDVEDAKTGDDNHVWVVRRTLLHVVRGAVEDRHIEASTWAGGFGARWALRRSRLKGDGGGVTEAESLWVHLERSTMRLAPLPPRFHEVYGEAAGGRPAPAKLILPAWPQDGAQSIEWPLRITDFDILAHVNNASYWAAVEDVLAWTGVSSAAWRAVMEYREPIDLCRSITLEFICTPSTVLVWFLCGNTVAAVTKLEDMS